ncbi:MAG: hypothetical protein WD669_10405 [Pirellulales bacterium]
MAVLLFDAHACLSEDLPKLELQEVVELYLSQNSAIRVLTADYSIQDKDLFRGRDNFSNQGTFGFDGKKGCLASKRGGIHAVFEGGTTKYFSSEKKFGTVAKRPATIFAHAKENPALLFDFMQDTEFTRVSHVLQDAIGPQNFGQAELLDGSHMVRDMPCYVIEGTYDRVKFNKIDAANPVFWKYRLCFDPAHGMQIVRKETFNMVEDVIIGIVEVDKLINLENSWIPVLARLTTFRYERKGEKLVAEPSVEATIHMAERTVQLNENADASLFSLSWPVGTRVRDQTKGGVYTEGADKLLADGTAMGAVKSLLLIAANLFIILLILAVIIRKKLQTAKS